MLIPLFFILSLLSKHGDVPKNYFFQKEKKLCQVIKLLPFFKFKKKYMNKQNHPCDLMEQKVFCIQMPPHCDSCVKILPKS